MEEIEKIEKFRSKLIEGFNLTSQRLLAFKRYKKTPLIVSKNGGLLEIYADEFEAKMKEDNVQLANEPSKKSQKKDKR